MVSCSVVLLNVVVAGALVSVCALVRVVVAVADEELSVVALVLDSVSLIVDPLVSLEMLSVAVFSSDCLVEGSLVALTG